QSLDHAGSLPDLSSRVSPERQQHHGHPPELRRRSELPCREELLDQRRSTRGLGAELSRRFRIPERCGEELRIEYTEVQQRGGRRRSFRRVARPHALSVAMRARRGAVVLSRFTLLAALGAL